MKILFFIVNYKADVVLIQCLTSLINALSVTQSDVHLSIHVFDNSEYDDAACLRLANNIKNVTQGRGRVHWSPVNAGYFGGLKMAQQLAAEGENDVVIYSNPDIAIAEDFFECLNPIVSQGGILAPAIVSLKYGFDQNPKYLKRLSRTKLERLQNVYGNWCTFVAYMTLARIKEILLGGKARTSKVIPTGSHIYAPHGATFVFTDINLFLALPEYPIFLFGEELFVAEEAARHGVIVRYSPELRISDLRSQSIKQLPTELTRKFMLSSIGYILDHYYSPDQNGKVKYK